MTTEWTPDNIKQASLIVCVNQKCDGKYLGIRSPEIKVLIPVFVDFHGICAPLIANFNVYLKSSIPEWEEMYILILVGHASWSCCSPQ